MPYSTNLKIDLMDNGTNSNTWGTVTNTNLGTALEQAIVGKADISMSSTTVTLTYTDTNAAQDARAIYLNLSGSPGGAATLVVPAIQKPYIVKNGSDEQVTIKVSGQTGVIVPVGKTVLVYNNGTDVVTSVDHIPSLTLASALPVASGGTGATTLTGVLKGNGTSAVTASNVNLASEVTGTLPVANGGTGIPAFGTGVATALGQNVSGSGSIALTTSPVFTTPNLGTPSAATLSNATGLPIDGGTTGTLPVARGGTGIPAFGTGVATALGQNVSGSGSIALTTSPVFVTPNLGTPSAATLSNATGLPIDGGTTGTLPIARGGTGATTNTQARTNLGLGSIATQNSNSVSITGGSISGITDLAVVDGGTGASDAGTARTNLDVPSRSGSGASGTWNISITGNAATATTASNGGVTSVNGQTGAITNTSLDAIGSVVMAAANTTSVLKQGDTIAGSNLYYPTGLTLSASQYYSEGSSGVIPSTQWTPLGVTRNTYSPTFSTPAGNVSTLSGTWRAMGIVYPRGTFDNGAWYEHSLGVGLFVRVS